MRTPAETPHWAAWGGAPSPLVCIVTRDECALRGPMRTQRLRLGHRPPQDSGLGCGTTIPPMGLPWALSLHLDLQGSLSGP